MTTETAGAPAGKSSLSTALGFLKGAVARATGGAPAQTFLTVCNARSGAEHLAASLASLDDIDIDCEVKWRPPYQTQPHQLALESAEDNLAERLQPLGHGRPLLGSSLVFDPYQPFLKHELDALLACIDPSTKVVHVTRGYFEMLKCQESRRGAARASDKALQGGAAEKLADTKLFEILAREAKTPLADDMFSGKPATTLAKTLLVNFINDLVCAKICEHVGPENTLRVSYDELGEKLPEIARFLGSKAGEAEIGALLSHPPVERHATVPDSFVPHFKLLIQLCRELDAVRDALLAGQWAVDDVWRDENPPLHLPQKVGAILAMVSALDVPTDIGLGQKLKAALGF